MMDIKENYSLKKYNSFNIDVVAKEFIQINSVKELIDLQKNLIAYYCQEVEAAK